MNSSQINRNIDPLVKAKLLKRQQIDKSIIVHYNYEQRFAHKKSKLERYLSFRSSDFFRESFYSIVFGSCIMFEIFESLERIHSEL